MKNNKTSASKDAKPKTKQVQLSDVVGQETAIRELNNFIFTMNKKEISNIWKVNPAKGLLLVGPPGTGKTMSVKALVNDLNDNVLLHEMKFKDIESQWIGSSVGKLKNYFANIEKTAKEKHVILFIDEIDAILPQRNERMHEGNHQRLTVFLEWMDGGINSLNNITLIGATNCPEKIDEAARRPGRFDRIVEFKPLNTEAIINAFRVHINLKQLMDNQLGEIDWDKIKDVISNVEISGAAIPNILDQILNEKAQQHDLIIQNAKVKNSTINIGSAKYFPEPIGTEDLLNHINNFLQSPHMKTN